MHCGESERLVGRQRCRHPYSDDERDGIAHRLWDHDSGVVGGDIRESDSDEQGANEACGDEGGRRRVIRMCSRSG